MEKKSKDTLRRYKKSRQHTHSSTESSTSDTDTGTSSSYSSSDSEHQRSNERHRKKKSSRRAGSSSGDERRKRDKRDIQKKLVAKRNHIKRKLKEARLKKRAAAALSGHGHRALSPATQAKLKKLAERKHMRAASKEQREREKLRAVERDRDRDHHRLGSSRSPPSSSTTTTTKIRIHQDVGKRQKSPSGLGGGPGSSSSRMHHQLMSREKIIIQTRARGRTPSLEREREREREREHERQRHEHKLQRHDDLSLRERDRRDRERERAEREAARDKERAEALARCQERQRERERLAREKIRRQEEEDKMRGGGGGGGAGERILGGRGVPERELDMPTYGSRERSLETVERGNGGRHVRDKREIDVYEREQEYMEAERHGMIDDMRRYGGHRRRELSPMPPEHYTPRMRDPRDIYSEEERERAYKRAYIDARYTSREREAWLDAREMCERELQGRDYRELDPEDAMYVDERERMLRERERERERDRDRGMGAPPPAPQRGDYRNEWDREWDEEGGGGTPSRAGGFVGGPKRMGMPKPHAGSQQQTPQQHHSASEPDWDADEQESGGGGIKNEPTWLEHDQREKPRAWQQTNDWRENDEPSFGRGVGPNGDGGHHPPSPHHHVHPRNERGRGFRRGGAHGHAHEMGERGGPGGYRPHPPPLMTLPVQPPGGYHGPGGGRGFPHKRIPYGGGSFLKKHAQHGPPPQSQQHSSLLLQHQSKPPTSAAQASAVAAATTAVAAAKAAAQSAANATTNPGILAQVSKLAASNHLNALEAAAAADSSPTPEPSSSEEQAAANEQACVGAAANTTDNRTSSSMAAGCEDKDTANGELSEISDSDDDILNKTDKVKPKCELPAEGTQQASDVTTEFLSTDDIKTEPGCQLPQVVNSGNGNGSGNVATLVPKTEDEEVLDFEEISDGELEEDARNKGIGDALGVDWQGLIAETRQQAIEYTAAQGATRSTSAKQRWQPYRVLLDMGISFDMAGEQYARQLIDEARQHLQLPLPDAMPIIKKEEEEQQQQQQSSYTLAETATPPSKIVMPFPEFVNTDYPSYGELLAGDKVQPLAYVQLGIRGMIAERKCLVGNVCGIDTRALCARQDLRLRRQLCGLPSRECEFPRNLPIVSHSLRSRALHMLNRRLDVK